MPPPKKKPKMEPVSFEEFKKLIENLHDICFEVQRDRVAGKGVKTLDECAFWYYESFYRDATVRQKYSYKLKACPKKIRDRLLSMPEAVVEPAPEHQTADGVLVNVARMGTFIFPVTFFVFKSCVNAKKVLRKTGMPKEKRKTVLADEKQCEVLLKKFYNTFYMFNDRQSTDIFENPPLQLLSKLLEHGKPCDELAKESVAEKSAGKKRHPVVSFEEFEKNLTNIYDIVWQLKLKEKQYVALDFEKCAQALYLAFYLKPEIRDKYTFKWRPCSTTMQQRLLSIPSEESAQELRQSLSRLIPDSPNEEDLEIIDIDVDSPSQARDELISHADDLRKSRENNNNSFKKQSWMPQPELESEEEEIEVDEPSQAAYNWENTSEINNNSLEKQGEILVLEESASNLQEELFQTDVEVDTGKPGRFMFPVSFDTFRECINYKEIIEPILRSAIKEESELAHLIAHPKNPNCEKIFRRYYRSFYVLPDSRQRFQYRFSCPNNQVLKKLSEYAKPLDESAIKTLSEAMSKCQEASNGVPAEQCTKNQVEETVRAPVTVFAKQSQTNQAVEAVTAPVAVPAEHSKNNQAKEAVTAPVLAQQGHREVETIKDKEKAKKLPNLPVTFNVFKRYVTNLNEIVQQMKLCEEYKGKSDTECAQEYYKGFYTSEMRKKFAFKLRPCPVKMRNLLLSYAKPSEPENSSQESDCVCLEDVQGVTYEYPVPLNSKLLAMGKPLNKAAKEDAPLKEGEPLKENATEEVQRLVLEESAAIIQAELFQTDVEVDTGKPGRFMFPVSFDTFRECINYKEIIEPILRSAIKEESELAPLIAHPKNPNCEKIFRRYYRSFYVLPDSRQRFQYRFSCPNNQVLKKLSEYAKPLDENAIKTLSEAKSKCQETSNAVPAEQSTFNKAEEAVRAQVAGLAKQSMNKQAEEAVRAPVAVPADQSKNNQAEEAVTAPVSGQEGHREVETIKEKEMREEARKLSNLPVTFHVFKRYVTNLNEIVQQMKLCEEYKGKSDTECGQEYYQGFYASPEMRSKFAYKLRPCPVKMRNLLLSYAKLSKPENSSQESDCVCLDDDLPVATKAATVYIESKGIPVKESEIKDIHENHVSFKVFKRYLSNLKEIAQQMLLFDVHRGKSEEECARDYYNGFYSSQELRDRFLYQLKPCPAKIRSKLISFPTKHQHMEAVSSEKLSKPSATIGSGSEILKENVIITETDKVEVDLGEIPINTEESLPQTEISNDFQQTAATLEEKLRETSANVKKQRNVINLKSGGTFEFPVSFETFKRHINFNEILKLLLREDAQSETEQERSNRGKRLFRKFFGYFYVQKDARHKYPYRFQSADEELLKKLEEYAVPLNNKARQAMSDQAQGDAPESEGKSLMAPPAPKDETVITLLGITYRFPVTFRTFQKYINYEDLKVGLITGANAKKKSPEHVAEILADERSCLRLLRQYYHSFYTMRNIRNRLKYNFNAAPPEFRDKLLEWAQPIDEPAPSSDHLSDPSHHSANQDTDEQYATREAELARPSNLRQYIAARTALPEEQAEELVSEVEQHILDSSNATTNTSSSDSFGAETSVAQLIEEVPQQKKSEKNSEVVSISDDDSTGSTIRENYGANETPAEVSKQLKQPDSSKTLESTSNEQKGSPDIPKPSTFVEVTTSKEETTTREEETTTRDEGTTTRVEETTTRVEGTATRVEGTTTRKEGIATKEKEKATRKEETTTEKETATIEKEPATREDTQTRGKATATREYEITRRKAAAATEDEITRRNEAAAREEETPTGERTTTASKKATTTRNKYTTSKKNTEAKTTNKSPPVPKDVIENNSSKQNELLNSSELASVSEKTSNTTSKDNHKAKRNKTTEEANRNSGLPDSTKNSESISDLRGSASSTNNQVRKPAEENQNKDAATSQDGTGTSDRKSESQIMLDQAKKTFFAESTKDHNIAYLICTSQGLKSTIWRILYQLTLEEFKTYTSVHNGEDLYRKDGDIQPYYEHVVDKGNWPLNLYVRLPLLRQLLHSKGVELGRLDLGQLSPKMLHWRETDEHTDFDRIVERQFTERTGKEIDSVEQWFDEREQLYAACWFHDQWIYEVPQITNDALHDESYIRDLPLPDLKGIVLKSLPMAESEAGSSQTEIISIASSSDTVPDSQSCPSTQLSNNSNLVDITTTSSSDMVPDSQSCPATQLSHTSNFVDISSVDIHSQVPETLIDPLATQAEIEASVKQEPIKFLNNLRGICNTNDCQWEQIGSEELIVNLDTSQDESPSFSCFAIQKPSEITSSYQSLDSLLTATMFEDEDCIVVAEDSQPMESDNIEGLPEDPVLEEQPEQAAVQPAPCPTVPVANVIQLQPEKPAVQVQAPCQTVPEDNVIQSQVQSLPTTAATRKKKLAASNAVPSKRVRLNDKVPQLRHEFRPLPLNACVRIEAEVLGTDETPMEPPHLSPLPQPDAVPATLTASQEFAQGNTLLESSQLTALLDALPPGVTVRKVNEKDKVCGNLNRVTVPETVLRETPLFRKLERFDFFAPLTIQQIIQHRIEGYFEGATYQSAILKMDGRSFKIRGPLLNTLFPHLSPQLHSDLKRVLNDLPEFVFSCRWRRVGKDPTEDLRRRVLFTFMDVAPEFGLFGLQYDNASRDWATCFEIGQWKATEKAERRPWSDLEKVISPGILEKMREFKALMC